MTHSRPELAAKKKKKITRILFSFAFEVNNVRKYFFKITISKNNEGKM